MSIRTSIMLVVSLFMVAGYVFFVQVGQSPEIPDEPPWFYNINIEDMRKIHISDHGEEVVFFLGEDNHWHLDDPEGLPVGLDRWGGINLLLSGPKSRRLLDTQSNDLEPYGLATPLTRIQVDLKEDWSLPVLLGLRTPDGVGIYAQVEGFPQVFIIVAEWADILTRLIRERPYPMWYYDIDPSTINRIAVYESDKSMGIVESDGGWLSDDESQRPVDKDKLSEILASLEQPTEQDLVEYEVFESGLAEYGLEESSMALFLQTEYVREDGLNVTEQVVFHFGDATEDGTGYYMQTEKNELLPDVFRVNASWVEGIQSIVDNPPYIDNLNQEN